MILLLSIVVAFAFTNSDSAIQNTSVLITPESSLIIKGTSNVNTFSCLYNIQKIKNPIPIIYHMEDGKMKFKKTVLVLNNTCFDCGGKGINTDFKKILKSETHPQIFLFLKEITPLENSTAVEANIIIEIAGVPNCYKIPVEITQDNDMLITGDLKVSLGDYQLKAPKKLFGLITVNDIIEISFKLKVKEN